MRSTFTTLKAISIFLTTKKEHILLIAKRQIFSLHCSPHSFLRIWFPFEGKMLKSISIFIHQRLSVIWRPLQPQSTSQLQPRGTPLSDATMRNYQISQEAICFNVECVLLQLTAIFFNLLTALLWYFLKDRRKCQNAAIWRTYRAETHRLQRREDKRATFI